MSSTIGKKKKEKTYQLIDNFTLFYFQFMANYTWQYTPKNTEEKGAQIDMPFFIPHKQPPSRNLKKGGWREVQRGKRVVCEQNRE